MELDRIINEAHPLVKLSTQMGRQGLDEHFGACFCEEGRPAINTRLMVSLHKLDAPCIAKGKIGRKYEFGHKVSVAVSATTNWVVAALGLPGNPYDGHTLRATLEKAEQNIKRPIKEVYLDGGDKGHGCDESIVTIDRGRQGKLTRTIRKKLKHRAAIEPVIGHWKSDCRLERNYLSGESGNAINAILSAAGYNFRKLLKGFWPLVVLIRMMLQGRSMAPSPPI